MSSIDDLTEDQIKTIQDSFQLLESEFDQLVADLYPTFLSRYPEYASYFSETNFQEQREGVVHFFQTAIPALDQPDELEPHLNEMARIHQDHDVPREAYNDMGTVVIELLSQYAGDHWNENLKDHWTTLWAILTDQFVDSETK
jgi:hemoglobin-like flavoprotein